LRREEEVDDTFDVGGQDSEEEEEEKHELEQEEEKHKLEQQEEWHYEGEARHYEDEVVGVTNLLQDPHREPPWP
jgi:hypothetical protein